MQDSLWGFFKRCARYSPKIPPTDGHSLCLVCLGEGHRTDTCTHCLRFSKRTHCERAARLCTTLLQSSLLPPEMTDALASTHRSSTTCPSSAPVLSSAKQPTPPSKSHTDSAISSEPIHVEKKDKSKKSSRPGNTKKKTKPRPRDDVPPEKLLAFPPSKHRKVSPIKISSSEPYPFVVMRDSCSPASSVASRLSAETLQSVVQHRPAPTVTQQDCSAPLTFDEVQLAYVCPCHEAVAQPLMTAEEEAAADQLEAQFRAELGRRFPQRNYITKAQTLHGPATTHTVTSASV